MQSSERTNDNGSRSNSLRSTLASTVTRTGRPPAFGTDRRAVSEVVGTVLVFAIVLMLVGVFQVYAIPNANAKVEFKHQDRVEQDIGTLHESLSETAATRTTRTADVELGTQYPNRLLFLNPPAASGTIRTSSGADVTLSNMVATGAVGAEDYWDGTTQARSTHAVIYRPNYNRYENAPTRVIEPTIAYEKFDDATILSGGTFISDRTINLVLIDGDYYESRASNAEINTVPLSAPAQTLSVTNTTDKPITISVPTRADNETWSERLEDEYASNGGYITDQSYKKIDSEPYNLLNVTLQGNEVYNLQMAKVGVGREGLAETKATYITAVEGESFTLPENGQQVITVEVRDSYNNPVSGVKVNADTTLNNGELTPVYDEITGEDGRVQYIYTFESDIDGTRTIQDDINISYSVDPSDVSEFDSGAPENTTITANVQNLDSSGLGNASLNINPASAGSVVLKSTDYTKGSAKDLPELDMTFENLDSIERQWAEARIAFASYSQDAQGSDPLVAEINRNPNDRLETGGEMEEVDSNVDFERGDTSEVKLEFDTNKDIKGDFLVLVVRWEEINTKSTYFVMIIDS